MAHSEEKKAQAVAALLSGVPVGEVSRRYGIPKATVSRFKTGIASYLAEHATEQQCERIGELLLSLLRENMAALSSIAKQTTTPEALTGQNVRGIVALHGTIGDLTVRLLYLAMDAGLFPEWNKMERIPTRGKTQGRFLPSVVPEISA